MLVPFDNHFLSHYYFRHMLEFRDIPPYNQGVRSNLSNLLILVIIHFNASWYLSNVLFACRLQDSLILPRGYFFVQLHFPSLQECCPVCSKRKIHLVWQSLQKIQIFIYPLLMHILDVRHELPLFLAFLLCVQFLPHSIHLKGLSLFHEYCPSSLLILDE